MVDHRPQSSRRRNPFTPFGFLIVLAAVIVGVVASFSLFEKGGNLPPSPLPSPSPFPTPDCGSNCGPSLSTGREYLTGREKSGYGLYSYLLFRKRPASGTVLETRYLAAIDAFKDFIPPVGDVENDKPTQSEVNVAYTPVRRVPPSGATAAQILQEYDFDRAQTLLQRLPSLSGDGPFIVSFRSPATQRAGDADIKIRVNMNGVDPRIISAWVDLFLKEANRVNFAGPDSTRRFLLNLRDLLAKAAEGLDSAKKGAMWWKETVAVLTPTEAPAKPK